MVNLDLYTFIAIVQNNTENNFDIATAKSRQELEETVLEMEGEVTLLDVIELDMKDTVHQILAVMLSNTDISSNLVLFLFKLYSMGRDHVSQPTK